MKAFEKLPLTPEQDAKTKQWANGNQDWIARYARSYRVENYIELHLHKRVVSHVQARNCLQRGKDGYVRKDGMPITQDDMDTIGAVDNGQYNIVEGKVGDLEVFQVWECDSGD